MEPSTRLHDLLLGAIICYRYVFDQDCFMLTTGGIGGCISKFFLCGTKNSIPTNHRGEEKDDDIISSMVGTQLQMMLFTGIHNT